MTARCHSVRSGPRILSFTASNSVGLAKPVYWKGRASPLRIYSLPQSAAHALVIGCRAMSSFDCLS